MAYYRRSWGPVRYNVMYHPIIELPNGETKRLTYFMETDSDVLARIEHEYPGAKILNIGR